MNLKRSLRHISTPVSANHQHNKRDDQPPSTSKHNPISKKIAEQQKLDRDNRANQLNPNHPSYWESRGFDSIPQP
jgi:hypothetical protein